MACAPSRQIYAVWSVFAGCLHTHWIFGLPTECTAKILIRMCGCAGRSIVTGRTCNLVGNLVTRLIWLVLLEGFERIQYYCWAWRDSGSGGSQWLWKEYCGSTCREILRHRFRKGLYKSAARIRLLYVFRDTTGQNKSYPKIVLTEAQWQIISLRLTVSLSRRGQKKLTERIIRDSDKSKNLSESVSLYTSWIGVPVYFDPWTGWSPGSLYSKQGQFWYLQHFKVACCSYIIYVCLVRLSTIQLYNLIFKSGG